MQPDIAPPIDGGPTCSLCGGTAVVHWQRRLTSDEVAAAQAIEQARRDEAVILADPQLPPPVFGPLPTCADWTRTVHGCIRHYITMDAAVLVHQAACTAPAEADLPGCNCTPEAAVPDPEPEPAPMPPGW